MDDTGTEEIIIEEELWPERRAIQKERMVNTKVLGPKTFVVFLEQKGVHNCCTRVKKKDRLGQNRSEPSRSSAATGF